jgi:hypothetical protein
VKVWCNEEGLYGYSANAAFITHPSLHAGVGGCPHPFGHIAFEVPDKVFKVLGFTPEMFAEEDSDDECEDDEEDVEEMD